MRQRVSTQEVADVAGPARAGMAALPLGERVKPGMRAAGGGQPGISCYSEVVGVVADSLRVAGADPFLVPAMGSHGAATAEGQRSAPGLWHGRTGRADFEQPGHLAADRTTPDGMPVHWDRFAAEADGVIVVNRIKAHTAFRAPWESGLFKIMAIVWASHWAQMSSTPTASGRRWQKRPGSPSPPKISSRASPLWTTASTAPLTSPSSPASASNPMSRPCWNWRNGCNPAQPPLRSPGPAHRGADGQGHQRHGHGYECDRHVAAQRGAVAAGYPLHRRAGIDPTATATPRDRHGHIVPRRLAGAGGLGGHLHQLSDGVVILPGPGSRSPCPMIGLAIAAGLAGIDPAVARVALIKHAGTGHSLAFLCPGELGVPTSGMEIIGPAQPLDFDAAERMVFPVTHAVPVYRTDRGQRPQTAVHKQHRWRLVVCCCGHFEGSPMDNFPGVKALTFDLGTVLDLGGSLTPYIAEFCGGKPPAVTADKFWADWRAKVQSNTRTLL